MGAVGYSKDLVDSTSLMEIKFDNTQETTIEKLNTISEISLDFVKRRDVNENDLLSLLTDHTAVDMIYEMVYSNSFQKKEWVACPGSKRDAALPGLCVNGFACRRCNVLMIVLNCTNWVRRPRKVLRRHRKLGQSK